MTSPACCIALVGVCARALVRACVHICSADCIVAITTLPPPIRTAPQQTSYWFCKLTQFDYFQAGPFMRTGYRIIFGWAGLALAMHLMHGTDFRRRCRNIDHAREKRMATGLGLERRSNFCHTHTVWFYVFFFRVVSLHICLRTTMSMRSASGKRLSIFTWHAASHLTGQRNMLILQCGRSRRRVNHAEW